MSKSTISQKEIAEFMRVTLTRIGQYIRDGWLPKTLKRGEVGWALAAYYRDRSDLTSAKKENIEKKNALLDKTIAERNGDLMSREEIESQWAEILRLTRDAFLRLPNELAPKSCFWKNDVEAEKEMRAKVEEILRELSER